MFVFRNNAVKPKHVSFTDESFFRKMLISVFSSNIRLCIAVEILCKVLEMELKTYTTVCPKFVFEKIKFKVLHCIQHDLIFQRPGFSKDQANMFKSLVINYFVLKFCHTSVKGDKYFFFINVGAECSLEIKLFIK